MLVYNVELCSVTKNTPSNLFYLLIENDSSIESSQGNWTLFGTAEYLEKHVTSACHNLY